MFLFLDKVCVHVSVGAAMKCLNIAYQSKGAPWLLVLWVSLDGRIEAVCPGNQTTRSTCNACCGVQWTSTMAEACIYITLAVSCKRHHAHGRHHWRTVWWVHRIVDLMWDCTFSSRRTVHLCRALLLWQPADHSCLVHWKRGLCETPYQPAWPRNSIDPGCNRTISDPRAIRVPCNNEMQHAHCIRFWVDRNQPIPNQSSATVVEWVQRLTVQIAPSPLPCDAHDLSWHYVASHRDAWYHVSDYTPMPWVVPACKIEHRSLWIEDRASWIPCCWHAQRSMRVFWTG